MSKRDDYVDSASCLLAEPGYCQCGCGRQTKVASKTSAKRGHVKGEPLRYVHGHGCRSNLTRCQRLERAIEFTDTCWLWRGAMSADGYGLFIERPQRRLAHVAVYDLLEGLPVDLALHHVCEVKRCVNPQHLRPITAAEHIRLHRPETHRRDRCSRHASGS